MNPHKEDKKRAHAEHGNAVLLAFYKPRIPRWSEGMKTATRANDREELAAIGKAYRLHGGKVSEWNIAAGEHASSDLVALEEYFESAARDIESVLGRPPDREGEEWKGEQP
jgi:hypothetical protein